MATRCVNGVQELSMLNELTKDHTPVMKKRVVILQEHLPHYRLKFYDCLREELSIRGVELQLIYSPATSLAAVPGRLDWAKEIVCKRLGKLVWQPVWRDFNGADLIIVHQENKYLINYLLMLKSRWGSAKLAYWGHGRNFQSSNPNGISERVKRFFSRHADWWFAYNDLSKRVVSNLGFPAERITSVGNSIDTKLLTQLRDSVTESQIQSVRNELGIEPENVAVYTGRFIEMKRIRFLVEACHEIRRRVPDFNMVWIGSGPLEDFVNEQSSAHSWIHFVGVKDDKEKVPYWMISKLLLMPGAVGLAVLDSFALGVPMVTTDIADHGPEIDYLKDGENGVIVRPSDSVVDYAIAVTELLKDTISYNRMRSKALAEAEHYSAETMALNFAEGVESALS